MKLVVGVLIGFVLGAVGVYAETIKPQWGSSETVTITKPGLMMSLVKAIDPEALRQIREACQPTTYKQAQ